MPDSNTLLQMRTLCQGADDEFFHSALARNLTPEQAARNWSYDQSLKIQSLTNDVTLLRAELETMRRVVDEQKATFGRGELKRTAAEKMRIAVNEIAATGVSRPAAICEWIRKNPDDYQEFLEESRSSRR